MRLVSSILFNPALLVFVVTLALINLVGNLVNWIGMVDVNLARISELTAGGFIIALVYTAIWERDSADQSGD